MEPLFLVLAALADPLAPTDLVAPFLASSDDDPARSTFELRAFHSDEELNALTLIPNQDFGSSRTHVSHGSRLRSGIAVVGEEWTLRVYYERLLHQYDAAGIGVDFGQRFAIPTRVFQPAIDVGVSLDYVGAERAVVALLSAGHADEGGGGFELSYVEGGAHVAGVLGFGPLEAQLGARWDGFTGDFDGDDASGTLRGSNVGGYCGLAFRHPDTPLTIHANAGFGEITGFEIALGWRF